jgi:diguanylate cyclase
MGGVMSTDSERWKNKYLNLIDDHEKLEKQFEDHAAHLRRAIIRLTVVAEGRDQDLDSQLGQAREQIRKDQINGLSSILDRIESGFERWQSHQETFHSQLSESLINVETQSDALPASLLKELKNLRKQVRTTDKAELLLAMVSIIAQWANAMVEAMEASGEGKASGKDNAGGWFSRLFNKEGLPPVVVDKKTGSIQQGDESTDILPEDKSDEGLNTLSSEASKVLTALISKLTLPSTEQPRAMRLLSKVKEGLHWYELVPALEILSDLVISALGTEQEEFESFLKNLNERLFALQNWLSQGKDLEDDFKSASNDFDEKMRSHLQDLKSVLSQSNNPSESLQGSVSQQLDEVFATLDGFKLEQRSREIAFEGHIKDLAGRIEGMEGDLQQAKQQLVQTQMKAMTDSLTQLPNRGAYDLYLEKEQERFRRYGSPLSLLVCDVDKFKRINDQYGHQAGDKVLQLISKQIKKGTRETDFLTRYGGEEFVVILPETDSEAALQVGEKIREQVASSPFHFKGVRVQITISCGIASFKKGYRSEQVFDAADAALYQAKENGRNQCKIGELQGLPGEEEQQD